MEKKISYLSKTYNDIKQDLQSLTKEYYPTLAPEMNDASIGSYFIDLNASVTDGLMYYIDRALQETNLESAQELGSLYSIARTNGVRLPGLKGAMAVLNIMCTLPLVESTNPNSGAQQRHPNWAYAPILRKGTKFAAGAQIFELDQDVDFSHQFSDEGVSDRTFVPLENSNGVVTSYRVTKTVTVVAGETKLYKREIGVNDIKPFFEVVLPFTDIMGIESIIFKEGDALQTDPNYAEFMVPEEYTPASQTATGKEIWRYFEVNNLAEQYRWGDVVGADSKPVKYTYGYKSNGINIPTFSITKGEWKPIRQKFITEFTDNNYLKIIFGTGYDDGNMDVDISKADEYSKYLISRMINNDAMGVLPKAGWTMYVLYRVGGGAQSNVAAGAINSVVYFNGTIGNCYDQSKMNAGLVADVRNSIKVTNEIPSVSGRDRLDTEEIRNFIKYHNGAADRCVTTKDYHARVLMMPYKYGAAYRVGVTEENNKIMIYLLGLNEEGYLTTALPSQYVKNLSNYLSEYRMINDFVEMKSGKIINVSFEIDLCVDKAYNGSDVIREVMDTVKNYMDINKHQMGEEIYLGDLEKEIAKTDGVLNIIDFKVFNEFNGHMGYSRSQTTQQVLSDAEYTGRKSNLDTEGVICRSQIDLDASDYILYTENDTLIELKYPEGGDIRIRYKMR